MTFPCVRCGACCRAVECPRLTADNQCSIYETRPDVCRVDEMRPESLPVAEWHAEQLQSCRTLHLAIYGQPLPER